MDHQKLHSLNKKQIKNGHSSLGPHWHTNFFSTEWDLVYRSFERSKETHVPAKATEDIGPQSWSKISKIVVSGQDF